MHSFLLPLSCLKREGRGGAFSLLPPPSHTHDSVEWERSERRRCEEGGGEGFYFLPSPSFLLLPSFSCIHFFIPLSPLFLSLPSFLPLLPSPSSSHPSSIPLFFMANEHDITDHHTPTCTPPCHTLSLLFLLGR